MSFVTVTKPRPQVALVTLNRPERMNAMAFDVMVPLREHLEALHRDNDVRVVILTGAGEGFCSGADLEESGTLPNADGLSGSAMALRAMELLEDVVRTLRGLHQPVIAAVNGAAIGGGLCLSLAADIRIASTGAYFRAAGINNGLTAGELGLSYLLPRFVGASRAAEIMLTGRDVDATEAERIGLVAELVEDGQLLERCYATAARILRYSRVGVELTKRSIRLGIEASGMNEHMTHEGLGQLYVRLTTGNFDEAMRARKQDRPPVFDD